LASHPIIIKSEKIMNKFNYFITVHHMMIRRLPVLVILLTLMIVTASAQETRLLRQPSVSDSHIAFTYGGDIWISDIDGSHVLRITSTQAVERNPQISPDGKLIAFTSNRSGTDCIYVVSIEGGTPIRLTWHPSASTARGWTPDGSKVLYSTSRDFPQPSVERLWLVPAKGGPSALLTSQWGTNGSFSPDGKKIIIDRINRWDKEWRDYRGGQNTSLTLLDLNDQSESLIPNDHTTDILPVWVGKNIYFLSDRDWTANIWSYSTDTKELNQVTHFKGSDIKWLSGKNKLAFERNGELFTLDPGTNEIKKLEINISGDFPWAETKWEDVSESISDASLSPTGKRALMESRGEIFTVPAEHGDVRNITRSSDLADRAPVWSPKGDKIAWFSDKGHKGYVLLIASQDGLSEPRQIPIGISKMAWDPVWSPDGKQIAFTDDDVRIRVIDIESGNIKTIDVGGINLERGAMGLTWSPDSKWLAYAKTAPNNFRRVTIWSQNDNSIHQVTNLFADAFSPAWDLDGKHLYFLASTEVALASGWANTSSMNANPEYACYVINLRKDDPSPFILRSDEEKPAEKKDEPGKPDTRKNDKVKKAPADTTLNVQIDFDNIGRRTIPLPIPERDYAFILHGTKGTIFIAENIPNKPGLTLQKFVLEDRKMKEFTTGAGNVSVSADGKKLLVRVSKSWKVLDTSKPGDEGKTLNVTLQMKLDRQEEWTQIFEEAWRYERDYFYDPNMHGRNWDTVYRRYAPLVPFIKHRTDLTWILDQMNGELSVGHSFVSGGDYPEVEKEKVGLLGADLVAESNRWKIKRIYTTESWNPQLTSPLDQPGVKIKEGYYLVGINGTEITGSDDPYQYLDGTLDEQTVLNINSSPQFEGSWKVTVKPIRSETALRQRAWVEDNRRLVDSLSDGQLAYVWIPNTSMQGLVSFNRYFFAQQDKKGAVIDERFNGGGLLDDYMVDLMKRTLRAAYTNEVPDGKPGVLPAGILGPKVLLINEMSGSGGDFFPWVFRQQKVGPLIGSRTWGGLVKSSVHYRLIDGGMVTAPDNAIFDPVNNKWIAENEGVPPDIPVKQDAASLAQGRDPQLERAVKEAMKLIQNVNLDIKAPPFSTPAK
jgi:tricorn protease